MTEFKDVEREIAGFRRRLVVIGLLVLLAFGGLFARLVVLQVGRHDDLRAQAERNRTAIVPVAPTRGHILDRNGVVLASNYSAYTLEITPSKVGPLDPAIDALSEVIEITPRDRRRFRKLLDESRNFESLPIRTRLSDEEVARFAAQRYRFPGMDIKARLFRYYPQGELGAHVVGYIGRINAAEKTRLEETDDEGNYKGTEYIGKLGIEQSYEAELHGKTGVEQIETSAGGRAVRRLASSKATPGNTVVLSIDARLQKLVEELYGERRGALVALDPKTGEVLAFVSKPTYDPNLFVEGIDQESWTALSESMARPLLNRALRGTYPPGSTYKPFMGLAALETGKRRPGDITNDAGSWTFGGHTYRSHGDGGLGAVDMHRSIVKSSNVYYYALANDMGVDAIHDFMAPLTFGQTTGLDLNGEVRGVLPSQAWKRKAYRRPEHQKWYAGETISLGIGQGYNTFTMLQLAQATSILANNGVKHQPHLALAVEDSVTGERRPVVREPGVNLNYKPENVAIIRRALVGVTQEGTATRVFSGAAYLSGGKTGTAQAVTIGQKSKYNAAALAEYQRDHALYMAFAPADKPTIALALIVENAGWGAEAAAPIARRVFDFWVAGLYPSEADLAHVRAGKGGPPVGKPRPIAEVPDLPAPPSVGGSMAEAAPESAPAPGPVQLAQTRASAVAR
ncbi:penicillin-binding protein 2 [Pseudorhodoferax sp. Leaf274]|uniref:penicillin-binding protein 2 n=1 Tax=Pseudorhodoferax sp. Leaf274 TaxID=1736318 RepID=UPI0007027053|nr:penicillin-binding protein 2 [Pseudorhodoferax sp. Leaf274]KQP49736.1 penicillin-binding protein 2 [Pseudorhodoferax sp. Leaf274]